MSETTEQVLIQVNLNADRVKEALISTNDKIELLKKQLQSATQELVKMEKAGDTNSVAYSELQEKIVGYNTQLKANVNISKAYEQQLTKSAQAGLLEKDSLAQKRAALAAASIEIANATKVNGEYDAETLKLIENTRKLKEQILSEAEAYGSTVENVGNYKQAIKEASLEAQKAEKDFRNGLISKQDFQVAIQKLGELKDAQKDFNEVAAASTNEGRVAAFAKGLSGLAGGIAAAQGAMALLGDESENVQKALLKVQSAMAISQGLKELAGLPDTLKALSVSLGIATTATTTNTVSKEANNVVTGRQVAVQQAAIVTSEQLGAAMTFMLGPIGLVAIGIGAVVAAFAIYSSEDFAAEIDNVTKSIESENKAHESTVDVLKRLSDARTAEAENALSIAEAEGKSAEEIKRLQEDVINSKRSALQSEVAENETHYQELTAQRNAASQSLLKDLDEEETKKAQAAKEAAEKEIEAIKKRNAEIQIEAKNLNTELEIIDIESEKRKEQIANEAATIRVSNIRNNRQREIESEKLALAQRIEELKKNEDENTELIYETRQASFDKINAINLKFDIEAQENRNKLAVLKTVEGSNARLEAETNGIIKLRNLQLREAGLTETEKQIIIKESEQKIFELKQNALINRNSLNEAEIESARIREAALLEVRKQLAGTPEAKFAVELDALNQSLQNELKAIELSNDAKNAETESYYQEQIRIAGNNKDEIARLNDEKNLVIKTANETADAEALARVLASGQATLDATNQFNEQQLQQQLDFNQLRLEAFPPEAEVELLAEKNALLEQQEILHAEATITNEVQLQETLDLIRKKYNKIEQLANQSRDQKNLKDASNYLTTLGSLFKQGGDEYKIFATARALIDTYSAATAATSLPPIGLGPVAGIPVAIRAVVAGLANVAAINGVQFEYGGVIDGPSHAQGGVPAMVGRTPIELEGGEAIINKRAVANPTYRSVLSQINSATGGVSFAGGGIPVDYSFVTQSISNPVIDQFNMMNEMVNAVRSIQPIVTVEDINIGQANTLVRESRASS